MAFDGESFALAAARRNASHNESSVAPAFRRDERLIVLIGASALGALLGFAAAMAAGRIELWVMIALAAPVLIASLHLTALMLREGLERRAYGCAIAAAAHACAVFAWPMTALLASVSPALFWIAPASALTALALLASCWRGSEIGIYRVSVMGLMVAALAAQQATGMALGT